MKYLLIICIAFLLMPSAISAHEHHAPHNGTLVELGEEFAHLELVLDPTTGTLTGYVLDGEAENPVRIEQSDIEIQVSDMDSKGGARLRAVFTLRLEAVPNVLTGETVGDTSEFTVRSDKLKGVTSFNGVISTINIKGVTFNSIRFGFPEGNEGMKQSS